MILDKLGKELIFLDGAMGTMLQEKGLGAGELPERWNESHAEEVIDIHRRYFEAGADIVLMNTFGANRIKFEGSAEELKRVIFKAAENAREGARLGIHDGRPFGAALDMGPTGKLLEPFGDLSFDDAYEAFRETAVYGEEAGADLIEIETMSDTYEIKAAVLAAKENTSLPVFATMVFDETGKLLTGGDVAAAAALLEGLRVDAIGVNCGLGPDQMLPLLHELRKYTSLPVIVKPNAGLPVQRDGKTCYDVMPEMFAASMAELVRNGACVIGGCCGTTPEYIAETRKACGKLSVSGSEAHDETIVSSYGRAVVFGKRPLIIGERINPTGKKKFKEALKTHDIDYILREGITQQDHGADILDVNVGLPDIDEAAMMRETVVKLQGVTSLPLQIDTVSGKAMELALRYYNGKAMINSVNGNQAVMDMVFPLIRRYGGVVVALTLDEKGIPETAEGRVKIAGRIIDEAARYGIPRKDIVVDVLTMTISSEPRGALTALEALKLVEERYGVKTSLGVSNISFGLPARPFINAAFYTMAMQQGLSAAIINPGSEDMMRAFHAFCALSAIDENCSDYIEAYHDYKPQSAAALPASGSPAGGGADSGTADTGGAMPGTLDYAIIHGLKEEAGPAAGRLLEAKTPLAVINENLIPALDYVGKGFAEKTIFLPQLLISAEAAKAAFDVLKEKITASGEAGEKGSSVIVATVHGDIHDIGKNIVKVLLDNYGFDVIDLGRNVAPELIVETALERNVCLVGLSALMTTTVVSMEETIRLLREKKPDCSIVVGGAVMNQDYANMIGADKYARDAMETVRYAQDFFQTDGRA